MKETEVDASTPVGHRILSVGGVLEREDPRIDLKHYSAVLEMDNGVKYLMGQAAIVAIEELPDDVEQLPTQILDGRQSIVGDLITHAVVRHRHGPTSGSNGPQLYLVLEGDRLMGVVPTQRGALLLVESVLTAPLVREHDSLVTLDGSVVSIDDIVVL